MKTEHKNIIRQLPKDLQKDFYFGYIMKLADDLSMWDETLEWFKPVRHIQDLKQKASEYEQLMDIEDEN